jgi:anti-sigma regulatory factor (Ser/Thr protein kinase)
VNGPGLHLNLEVVSDPRLLCVVRAAIENFTEICGFSPPDCRAVTRAVDEAVANVIRHAYGNQPGQLIKISCRLLEPEAAAKGVPSLEIVMLDEGAPFEKEKVKERSLDEVKPGGLGLHFIRDSMDLMEHRRVGKQNQLRLVKQVKAEKPIQACEGE